MSRFCFCNCPAGFSADPERHTPDCPGRSGAGKARTPVPATLTDSQPVDSGVDFGIDGRSVRVSQEAYSIFLAREASGREKIAALQQRLTAADEELDQCQNMALMIEEKEWAEHVGTGPISSRVESAFTQMHNELSEARQGLTAADERADAGIAFVARLIRCSEGQPSIASGYLRDILGALKQTEGVLAPTTCTWQYGAFSWHTACGQEWMLNDGTPEQNGMRFCHSCGNALVAEEPEDA